jgi:hypothetical protein
VGQLFRLNLHAFRRTAGVSTPESKKSHSTVYRSLCTAQLNRQKRTPNTAPVSPRQSTKQSAAVSQVSSY